MLVYIFFVTLKFLWGLCSNCKHLNQGLQVISSTNEVFVAKRVMIFSVIHLTVMFIISLLAIASVW